VSTHALDAAVALQALRQEGSTQTYSGATHPAWQNMVGPFGGITAATLLNGAMLHPQCLGEPVSLTVNYCAAVADGGFEITAKPVRTNRSTQHWYLELLQNGETVMNATAVTAARRDTYSVQELPMPAVPSAEETTPIATLRRRPGWTHCYDWRLLHGDLPEVWEGALSDTSLSRLWIRDEPQRPLDFLSLAALCDSFFPRIYVRRAQITPIGTVSFTVYFHADSQQLAQVGSAHVLAQANGQQFRNGFFDQTGAVWAADGSLLATTHQIVYYKQ
jgi:acyl-coenzyme A thioesterase PaaI-like protein